MFASFIVACAVSAAAAAVLQVIFRTKWLAVIAPTVLGALWSADKMGVFFKGHIQSMPLAYFISFSPFTVGPILVASVLGMLGASLLLPGSRQKSQPIRNPEEAIERALEQFRSEGSVRTKCTKCESRIEAKRVLSEHRTSPDIELSCRCGECSGVYPFHAARQA